MENAGAVTIREDYVFRSRVTDAAREARGETILHEMAHMWFGDLVTMRWWDDLWLNESFATWAGTLAPGRGHPLDRGLDHVRPGIKTWAYRQDQLPSTHPIVADIPDIEDGPGQLRRHHLRQGRLGAQAAGGLRRPGELPGRRAQVLAAHAWGNATLSDLLAALEETSGRDLEAWSREWLETAGVNTLRPEYRSTPTAVFTSFAVRQEAAAAHPVLRPHRIAIGMYSLADGRLISTERIELDIAGSATAVPDLVGVPRPDLVLLNDDDLSYAKVRLDDRLAAHPRFCALADFDRVAARALCWAAAWDMSRDGEMAARDYLELVLTGSSAADIGVVQSLQRQAELAARTFADPAWRPAGLELMARSLRSWPSGAGRVGHPARLGAGVHRRRHLRRGPGVPRGAARRAASLDGLSVDTDLRWSLLGRLVSRGMAGEAEIAAELARDATDAGERHAAACRAAVPTRRAKLAAWESLTGGDLPLATFRAVLGGFTDVDQPELTGPYRERYFAMVGDAWRDWSAAMAQYFVSGCTRASTCRRDLAATDGSIAAAAPPAALKRLLSEGRDDVMRALRCQERDRQAG